MNENKAGTHEGQTQEKHVQLEQNLVTVRPFTEELKFVIPGLDLTDGHVLLPHPGTHNLLQTTGGARRGQQPWLLAASKGTQPSTLGRPKESGRHALPSTRALQAVLRIVKGTEPTYHQSGA